MIIIIIIIIIIITIPMVASFFSKATGLGLQHYVKKTPPQVFSWGFYDVFETTVLLNSCMVVHSCHSGKLIIENKNKKNTN